MNSVEAISSGRVLGCVENHDAGAPSALDRRALLLGVLLVALLGAAVISAGLGAVTIAPMEIVRLILASVGLSTAPIDPLHETIFWNIRLPRVLLGVLVGATLGLGGAISQAVFRNPLAEPGLIGISTGAALAVVGITILGAAILPAALHQTLGGWLMPAAAFCGGLAATWLVQRLARTRGGRMSAASLVLAGIALNSFAGALTGLLLFVADDAQLRTVTFWTLGSLGSASWSSLTIGAPLMVIPAIAMLWAATPLNALVLGEAEAGHTGIRVERLKTVLFIGMALGVGAAVSLSGVIGFVGLVVPHLLRLAMGPDHRFLIPGSIIGGALLLVVADAVARTVAAPAEIPLGVLTALVGGPFFLWMLRRAGAEVFA